jgi:hypothetical protein
MSGIFGPFLWQFPRNEAIASSSREEAISWSIDIRSTPGSEYPTNVVRVKDLVRLRHPYWYDPLVQPVRQVEKVEEKVSTAAN